MATDPPRRAPRRRRAAAGAAAVGRLLAAAAAAAALAVAARPAAAAAAAGNGAAATGARGVALVHMHDGAPFFLQLGALTLANKRRYAARHGYEMVVHTPEETSGLFLPVR